MRAVTSIMNQQLTQLKKTGPRYDQGRGGSLDRL
ncbi:hypothetical protein [Secundilactobacillus odoratitofui]